MSAFEPLTVLAAQVSVEAERLRDLFQGTGVLHTLELAAETFVGEAERRGTLSLDLVEGLKGLVIEVAMRRYGSDPKALEKAFVLLGREGVVKLRNHWSQYRYEGTKLAALRKAFATPKAKRRPKASQ